jgi:hypothetical protein
MTMMYVGRGLKRQLKTAKPSAVSRCQRLCLIPISAVFREDTVGLSNRL